MQFIMKSLGVKVLLLTSLLTIIAFAGLFLANSYWQRQSTLEEIRISAERTSDMLEMAIEEPMSLGDNEGTVSKFNKMAKRYPDITIYLTNFKGNITYSTDPEMIRKDVFDVCNAGEECDQLIKGSLDEFTQTGGLFTINGDPHFVEFKSVKNEETCHHCHGESQPILGTMIMAQDVTRQMNQLSSDQLKGALISLASLVALLAALLIFMKTSVVNRIINITKTTEDVSKGNLNADFHVKGQDELADLATYLGNMVSRIKDQLEYNKSILSGIIVPIMVSDKDERIEFINPPLMEILNMTEEDVLGHKDTDILKSDTNAQVLASGQSQNGSIRFHRDDGVEFPLHYEASPLLDANDNIVGAITVLIDLTQEEQDRKRIEANRQNLLEVAEMVTEVALKLSSASEQLSTQMDELTGSVDTSSNQTQQVATAMEEMNATVLEVAKNAGDTAEASENANKVAREGGVVVQNTVNEIHAVADTTEGLAKTLHELSDRAENIGKVMAVINDIADQTNLLALNAAIEAARAGEAGRGFAVVADEVRKLAEKTMTATKEVEEAITLIQQGTNEAVDEMGNARDRVVKTAEMAEQAGSVLKDIVDQADSIADMVRSIATAAEQQSATSDEINNNITEISGVSSSISNGIQEANIAIQEVATMAQRLSELVDRFKE